MFIEAALVNEGERHVVTKFLTRAKDENGRTQPLLKWILMAPLVILGLVLFVAIGGAVVQQLWNWLLPSIFGWRPITFCQVLGMLALCRILIGGFGGHGAARSKHRTPEERERFRQRVRERWGFGASSSDRKGQGATP